MDQLPSISRFPLNNSDEAPKKNIINLQTDIKEEYSNIDPMKLNKIINKLTNIQNSTVNAKELKVIKVLISDFNKASKNNDLPINSLNEARKIIIKNKINKIDSKTREVIKGLGEELDSRKTKNEETFNHDVFQVVSESKDSVKTSTLKEFLPVQSSALEGPPNEEMLLPEGIYLHLGDRLLPAISAQDLHPGDIICTYESTSTSPVIVTATLLQKFSAAGRAKNLSNLLHFEVVLDVKENGVVKIAHASGDTKTILIDTQNLNKFPPGTAAVAISPKNDHLRQSIIDTATVTANKGNKWKIKGISDSKTQLPKVLANMMLKTKNTQLRKMARLAVDSDTGFRKKDVKELKDMSCVQYVSNVVNSSLIKQDPAMQEVLENSNLSREEKVDIVFNKLSTQKKDEILSPAGLFHDQVSSSSLFQHMLTHQEDWEIPGYIGVLASSTPSVSVSPSELHSAYPITATELEALNLMQGEIILDIFHQLDICNSDNYIIKTDKELEILLLIAFTYIQIKITEEKPESIINSIKKGEEKAVDFHRFLSKINSLGQNSSTNTPSLHRRSVQVEPDELNAIALKVLKSRLYSGPEQNKLYNVYAVETYTKLAERITAVGSLVIASTFGGLYALAEQALVQEAAGSISSSSGLLVGLAAIGLGSYFAGKKISQVSNIWKNRIISSYELTAPTHSLYLHTRVEYGRRPWIIYSGDKGKTWHQDSLDMVSEETWKAKIRASNDIQYKLFIGPWDENASFPMENAAWQDTADGENIHISWKDAQKGYKKKGGLTQLPDCIYPKWNKS